MLILLIKGLNVLNRNNSYIWRRCCMIIIWLSLSILHILKKKSSLIWLNMQLRIYIIMIQNEFSITQILLIMLFKMFGKKLEMICFCYSKRIVPFFHTISFSPQLLLYNCKAWMKKSRALFTYYTPLGKRNSES